MTVLLWLFWMGGMAGAGQAGWGFWATLCWPYFAGEAVMKAVARHFERDEE